MRMRIEREVYGNAVPHVRLPSPISRGIQLSWKTESTMCADDCRNWFGPLKLCRYDAVVPFIYSNLATEA